MSRIFIEPPDEASTSCEESDEDSTPAVSFEGCEIVLRNGKRFKTHPKPQQMVKNDAGCKPKNVKRKSNAARRSGPKLIAEVGDLPQENCDGSVIVGSVGRDVDRKNVKRKSVGARKTGPRLMSKAKTVGDTSQEKFDGSVIVSRDVQPTKTKGTGNNFSREIQMFRFFVC